MKGLSVFCLVLGTLSVLPAMAAEESFCVYPKQLLLHGERIVAFELKLNNASVRYMSRFPKHWGVSIDNDGNEDPKWHTTLNASCGVGAAALYPKDLMNLLFIDSETNHATSDIEAELDISVSKDLSKSRKIILRQNDLIFRSVKPR